MQVWDEDRAADLAALLAVALPAEDLSADELLTSCWDDLAASFPDAGALGVGAVLGTDDGRGAVAVVVRPAGGDDEGSTPTGFVQVVAVHPAERRAGRGHALMAAAEAFAWDHGAGELRLEGAPPFYLWPGVDATATEMTCLAEARRYRITGSGINMALPATFRAPDPEGVTLRRVLDDADVARVDDLLARWWPEWRAEARQAVEHGCCHGAFGPDGAAVGFVCHSVSRAGWLGPMGTDPDHRGGGVGAALLGQVGRDLMIAGYPTVEICWAGPVRFYAKHGAVVSRVFRQYRLPRP